jgi:hypothetical protein
VRESVNDWFSQNIRKLSGSSQGNEKKEAGM